MAKNIYRNSRSHLILKYLAIGTGIAVVSLTNPAGGARILSELAKIYYRKRCFEKDKFMRDLRVLQKREMVDYKELADGNIEIKILKTGKEKVLQFDIEHIELKTAGRWDKKWRIVSFDVPEKYKTARNALRRHLYRMGFYFLQRSVAIIPYSCEDEIDFIASFYAIRDHILIAYVDHFEGEDKLKYHFGI
ncbi:hypothetical protein A2755_03405 [Candidatus Wolfebacteria bacterium RIFCSPHIGHO2_01_FULL_48_22]|uniref:Transcriptional repressor PaaX-like central Cas2-like domain-containing protein n=2 Tax=Candidatus Wolfeibacteriota TaxID=1752735 RepID=A0A1F8DPM9_9BACT|nr:MAG: hypothetical protein A2755_03405 [Candidatus Wolfebacteria bacterium RIFCSPHIGHO2_01_FULL_48_22]OGM92074.1 MAG: hypothetical protein A2935_01895 [Candidatus Wolfebacteria bacterium RIFCSPLOWO2_01_FULL_47_17b]